jgi:hypothetical protein
METAAQGHQLAHRGGAARLLPLQIGSKRDAVPGAVARGGRFYGYYDDRTLTDGYEPTREAAMDAFAKSWRRS